MKYLYRSKSISIPHRLLFIPLKETVIFPYVVAPLFFKSDEALAIPNKVLMEDSLIGCIGLRDPSLNDPHRGPIWITSSPCHGIRKRWTTLNSAVLSLLREKPVPHEMAMTGELTLSGRVLPVGGIKEKILAARRPGVKTVILPKQNEKNFDEIPDSIQKEMHFVFVEHSQEVLDLALPS